MQLLLISFDRPIDENEAVIRLLKDNKQGILTSIARNVFLLQTDTSPNNLLKELKKILKDNEMVFIFSSLGHVLSLSAPEEIATAVQKMQAEQFVPEQIP